MSGDDSNVIVGGTDGKVRVLDASTYAIKETISCPGGNSAVALTALPGTPDSFILANDPWTYVFDGTTQRPNKGAIGIVQDALDQVRRREQILEALLVLDADGLAAKFIGNAQRGGVHLALLQHLRLRQVGGLVGAEVELHAFGQ